MLRTPQGKTLSGIIDYKAIFWTSTAFARHIYSIVRSAEAFPSLETISYMVIGSFNADLTERGLTLLFLGALLLFGLEKLDTFEYLTDIR